MSPASLGTSWRTPLVVVICGCPIALLTFGPRSTFGFFMQPMSQDFAWGRDVFALAFALQNLLWGLGQPFAGAIADRFGTVRVIAVGALLYAAGLALMRYSDHAARAERHRRRADRLRPLRLFVQSRRLRFRQARAAEAGARVALGAGTAAGSFGQFLFAPFGVALIDNFGWQTRADDLRCADAAGRAAVAGAGDAAGATAASCRRAAAEQQSFKHALSEAFGHRSYVLLVLGFFTCGFQLAFVTAHLPAYLVDRGARAHVGGWVIAVIGLFNIVGSLGVGWLANIRAEALHPVGDLFHARAVDPRVHLVPDHAGDRRRSSASSPASPGSPPCRRPARLVALMFGTRWFATLYGFAFFSHQVGGFLGVWLGGIVFEATGSYNPVWWLSIFFGVASALINLPIVEKPVERGVAQPA